MSEKIICPHCNKEFSKYGIKNHIFLKHTEEGQALCRERIAGKDTFGESRGWSKGLTKDTDQRIKNISNSIQNLIQNGNFKSTKGYKMSNEFKQKRREEMLKRYENGFDPKCGRAPKFEYNSPIAGKIKVDGSWELKVAQYLDRLSVKWERNKKRFPYINELGKNSTYRPDFYVYDWDCFIEVKGYKVKKDDFKWEQFPKDKILQVWNWEKLKELNIL